MGRDGDEGSSTSPPRRHVPCPRRPRLFERRSHSYVAQQMIAGDEPSARQHFAAPQRGRERDEEFTQRSDSKEEEAAGAIGEGGCGGGEGEGGAANVCESEKGTREEGKADREIAGQWYCQNMVSGRLKLKAEAEG